MDSTEWGILQLEIVRHDHQGLKVDGVLAIVGKKGLQSFFIFFIFEFLP